MGNLSFYLAGVATLPLTSVASAAAEDCDTHAAAMVAEMQASRTAPLSESESALIRETALKSCKATSADSGKANGAAVDGDAAGAAASDAVRPDASTAGDGAAGKATPDKEKEGFWSGLADKMKTPYPKKAGQERLKSRGSGQP